MDHDFMYYDNGQLCMEYVGKHYPVAAVQISIWATRIYLVQRAEKMVYTKTTEKDDKIIGDMERGSMLFVIDVPELKPMGKHYSLQFFSANQRKDAREFFTFLHRDDADLIPLEIIGSVRDIQDHHIVNLLPLTLDKVSGKCYSCQKNAIDTCSICDRRLCADHDIIGKLPPVMALGYCEDCLYVLDLLKYVPEPVPGIDPNMTV